MEDKPARVHTLEIKPRRVGATFDIQKQKALETITDLVMKAMNLTERPDPNSTPSDHGMDSLGFIELVLDLEERTEHDFPGDPGVTEHSTLAEIAEMAAKELCQ